MLPHASIHRHRLPVPCASALTTADPHAAPVRAEALGCIRVTGRVGQGELDIPAVQAPDGSLLYFCPPADTHGHHAFEADFVMDLEAVPGGQIDPWVLFQRAVLGLQPQRSTVLHDPFGIIRSREIESTDKAIRTSLIVSERENTAVSRSAARFGGRGCSRSPLRCMTCWPRWRRCARRACSTNAMRRVASSCMRLAALAEWRTTRDASGAQAD